MKLRTLFIASLAAVVAFSCGKGGEDPVKPNEQFTVVASEMTFTGDASEKNLAFIATSSWTASTQDEWISLDKTSGGGSADVQNIKVTVTENNKADRAGSVTVSMGGESKTVSVKQSKVELVIKEGDGTKDHPYNVTQAHKLIVDGKAPSTEVYVMGLVVNIVEVSTSFGNATYDIADSEDAPKQVRVYRGKYLNGDNFTSQDQILKGDLLVVKGVLTYYNNTTPEVNQGNVIDRFISRGEPAKPEFSQSTNKGWLELPATDEKDGFLFVTHDMKIGTTATRNFSYYYDDKAYVANWVAYPLSAWNVGNVIKRTDAWGYDPKLPSEKQPLLASGFSAGNPANVKPDRGHQIPSADRLANYGANAATFYYTNMTPQRGSKFNQSIWGVLEDIVRNYSTACDTLYVVTGCVTKGSTEYAKDNSGKQVTMPVGYYKALLYKKGNTYGSAAFWLDHKDYSSDRITKEYMMTVSDLEKKTGVDFYVNLPAVVGAAKAAEIESADPTKDTFWTSKVSN